MSAIDTVLRVMQWAMAADSTKTPPVGDVHGLEQLSDPPEDLKQELAQLVALTAGRMCLGNPPLNDPSPVDLGALLIAAAIGLRYIPVLAPLVLSVAPEPVSPIDWIARHGLVEPVLRFFTESKPIYHDDAPSHSDSGEYKETVSKVGKRIEFGIRAGTETRPYKEFQDFRRSEPCVHPEFSGPPIQLISDDFRLHSPLTALTHYPVKGYENLALAAAERFLQNRDGRLYLVMKFAKPTPNPLVREWRKDMLLRYNTGDQTQQDFVLEVFEAMMIHYRKEAMDQVKAAHAVFNDPRASANEEKLRDALSVAAWWQPLWSIERSNIDALRARPFLHYDYLEGIKLFKLSQRMVMSNKV